MQAIWSIFFFPAVQDQMWHIRYTVGFVCGGILLFILLGVYVGNKTSCHYKNKIWHHPRVNGMSRSMGLPIGVVHSRPRERVSRCRLTCLYIHKKAPNSDCLIGLGNDEDRWPAMGLMNRTLLSVPINRKLSTIHRVLPIDPNVVMWWSHWNRDALATWLSIDLILWLLSIDLI